MAVKNEDGKVVLKCEVPKKIADGVKLPPKHDIKINLNGELLKLDQRPIIRNDRTLVPIRVVSEGLGANVSWDGENQTAVIVSKEGKKINVKIGEATATVDGEEHVLDVLPAIVNDRTMVPMRFIAEAFGATVEWDGDTKSVIVIL